MLLKVLPNRCLLILLKRLILLLIVVVLSYICFNFITDRSIFLNKTRHEKIFLMTPNVTLTVDVAEESKHFEKPALKLVRRFFVGQAKEGLAIDSNGVLPAAAAQPAEKVNDALKHRKILQLIVDDHAADGAVNDDDDSENTTRLIDGRLVRMRQRFVPSAFAPDDEVSRRAQIAQHRRSANTTDMLPLCAEPSPHLIGFVKQTTLLMKALNEGHVIRMHKNLKPGGSWRPTTCRPRYKVAIIVPFRDRQSHLTRLIDFLVPILQRQLLDFRFIVTEQYGGDLFNKGRIMNAAFEFAQQRLDVDCVIFHDVDMFPQDDRNFYGCPLEPRHIGAFVDSLGYELWYNYIVGGALAIQVDHYVAINGYSNMFWAWGGEDDDMGLRILAHNFTIERPDPVFGRMTMLKHVKRQKTAPVLVSNLLKSSDKRWVSDGLNNTSWKILKIQLKPLYYHLYVDVGPVPNEWRST